MKEHLNYVKKLNWQEKSIKVVVFFCKNVILRIQVLEKEPKDVCFGIGGEHDGKQNETSN